MKVMGHRGAAGLALENTLSGFELARLLGVDSIELDIHITKDNQLVVVHDNDLKRVSGKNLSIKNHTYSQIKKIKLLDGSTVPTLQNVIDVIGKTPLVIEIKADNCIDALLDFISKNIHHNITIASFRHGELKKLRNRTPDLKIFGLEKTKPIEIIQLARALKLDGVGLNYWLLNPLTYWLCKRYKLGIYVYTVNNRFNGWLIGKLYPRAVICTDFPERFLKHSITNPVLSSKN